MAKRSKRKKGARDKKFHQRKGFIFSIGIVIGIVLVASLYQASVYFSTNESCMMCHVHPTWTKVGSYRFTYNGSGVMVDCIGATCHPPVIRGRTTLLNCHCRPKGCVGIPYQGYRGHQLGQEVGTGVRGEVHPQRIVREVPSGTCFLKVLRTKGLSHICIMTRTLRSLIFSVSAVTSMQATIPELLARSNGGDSRFGQFGHD